MLHRWTSPNAFTRASLALLAALACAPASALGATNITLDPAGSCMADASGPQLIAPQAPRLEVHDEANHAHAGSLLTIDEQAWNITRALHPGDAFVCTLTVRNRSPHATTLTISTIGLLGSRTQQTRVVQPDDSDIGATAANWIDPVANTVKLRAEQYARVPLVITVPPNAPVGGVFAQVLVIPSTPTAAAGTANVGVVTGAAATLFTHVGGAGRAQLAFADQRTHKLRTSRATWTWRARLDNDGTLQAIPSGRLRVRSILGRTVAKFDIRERPLLPRGGIQVRVMWKDTPWFGIYRWDASVGSQGDARAKRATARGWIIALPPWWIDALVVVLVLGVIAWTPLRRRREWRSYMDDDASDIDAHDD